MDTHNSLTIETLNLSKSYKKVQALQDFNLKLTPGILGLLGPNGAGKSTLMRMLATITTPTAGTILWNGHDAVKEPFWATCPRTSGFTPTFLPRSSSNIWQPLKG
jgi:ABC-type multidrug transport system ATPase subunit